MWSASKVVVILVISSLCLIVGCSTPRENQPEVQSAKPISAEAENGMALLYVAGAGNVGVARNLLDQGVDVNFRGKDGNTPIMEAAYAGQLEMVKLLLDHGADLSAKKNDGATPTVLASGRPEILELFNNVTALVAAASKGDNKTLKQLIDRGVPVNGIDQNGQSALSESSWNGRTASVQLLLESGALPTIKKPDGETPLSLAAARKHPDIVALLNQAAAKPSSATAVTPK